MRTVIGAVAVVFVLAGCSAERAETPVFDSTSTSVSTPPTKPGGPTSAPVKHTAEKTRSCPDIRQQVSAELPV